MRPPRPTSGVKRWQVPTKSPYMSGPEVARLFGVHPHTVWYWGAKGILTRTRPRPRSPWRYAEGEVMALYRRQVQERAA